MTGCPFGYKADHDAEEVDHASAKKAEGEKEDVSWFYSNQTNADKEFEAKKRKQHEGRRQRLERIMAQKKKQLEFEPELDNISIASSELSELNSDVHSLKSLKSCAESWIEDTGYKAPAEAWVKAAATPALMVTLFCAFHGYCVWQLTGRAAASMLNTHWLVAGGAAAVAMLACVGVQYYAATKRSKRLLLGSEVGLMVVYTASAALSAFMYANPTTLDTKFVDSTCQAQPQHSSVQTCRAAMSTGRELSAAFPWFLAGCVGVALAALCLASLGMWYAFELAFIEKKAAKHMKRHRHHKHRIPWHKIKIVGPVMTCGQGGGGGAGAKGKGGGGKCPVMH